MRISPEEWKYFVIEFSGNNENTQNLRLSADLLKNDINIGFSFLSIPDAPGYGRGDNRFISSAFFVDHLIDLRKNIILDSNELLEIPNNYENIVNLDVDK